MTGSAKFDFNIGSQAGFMVTSQVNTCTKAKPWKEGDPVPVLHADAREAGDQRDGRPGGDLVKMECPNCGARWTAELPQ